MPHFRSALNTAKKCLKSYSYLFWALFTQFLYLWMGVCDLICLDDIGHWVWFWDTKQGVYPPTEEWGGLQHKSENVSSMVLCVVDSAG